MRDSDRDASFAHVVMERCDSLARFSEEGERLTRRFATQPMRAANDAVAAWMRQAGMEVHTDNIGNLIGRLAGTAPQAKTMLLGSHLDTVRDAGRYDGPLGVLVALACVERLHESSTRLPFHVEVVAFADEEGLRYHSTYLGSAALAGAFDAANLERLDADGISMAAAIRAFGGDPGAITDDRLGGDGLLGYYEVHIEQGPVLEKLNLPVGVVSAIAGQSRISVTFTGHAGHAGTVPMGLRHDALCAAAEFVLAVETQACAMPGLVATIGQMTVEPGASNVIPGRAALSLDVRCHDDIERERACDVMREQATAIAARRGVACDWQGQQQNGAIRCDDARAAMLARCIEKEGYRAESLTSGAGHDAVPLSAMTPVTMLFVRCAGGISHHPDEAVSEADVAVALEVTHRFLTELAHEHPDGP